MSETYLKYKGYLGTIEPQLEDNTLYGKVAFIRDLVTYEATTLEKLKQEFEASIDDYLGFCEEQGKKPDTPFKGSFNVRTGQDLHREAMLASGDQSLNAFICDAIREKIAHEVLYKDDWNVNL